MTPEERREFGAVGPVVAPVDTAKRCGGPLRRAELRGEERVGYEVAQRRRGQLEPFGEGCGSPSLEPGRHRVHGSDEAVGRRLDFLMQELNREANTLGSKSADAETTKAAVELKVLIEQMREQIQNVE